MLNGFVEMNKENEVIIDMSGKTSREGVFAAGDVTNIPYKQAGDEDTCGYKGYRGAGIAYN